MEYGMNNDRRFLILVMLLSKFSSKNKKIDLKKINEYLKKYSCKELSRSTFIKYINSIEELQKTDLWNNFFGKVLKDKEGRHNVFYMTNLFDKSELRILSDLIYATKALSQDESNKFSTKLEKFTDVDSYKFRSNYLIEDKRIKTDTNIKSNIDKILDAVIAKKKIIFNYCEYDKNKKLVCKLNNEKKPKSYIATPIDIFLKKDFYYLVLKRDNKKNFANYRIDKICNIEILNEKSELDKLNFDLSEHINKSVYMFTGEKYEVQLEIDKKIRGLVLDELGQKIRITMIGVEKNRALSENNKILVTFNSTIDEGMVSWIMQLRSGCKVIKPKFLRDKILDETKKIVELYS